MRVIQSSSAAIRLDAARRFLLEAPPSAETLVLGATRGAADDFVRAVATGHGATFGIYRFSLTQLAARLAAPLLAADRLSAATALGIEAVAARAVYDAQGAGVLTYFGPVAASPGFPRALARTLEELSLAAVSGRHLHGASAGASDLAELLARFEAQFDAVATVDRAAFLAAATHAAADADGSYARCRLVLLDLAVTSTAEAAFVRALVGRAPAALATLPAGDAPTGRVLASMGVVEAMEPSDTGLDRVRRYLFAPGAAPAGEPLDAVELFSAPGEGREAVEIARRILREARSGVPFDRMAIAVRAPQHYAGLLEHALERAGIPAYFERGTRRPHPAGRAFLALIACAQENLSARRFAEYLSLAQVPKAAADADGAFPAPQDDVFGALAERADLQAQDAEEIDDTAPGSRAFRAPWKWERLLAESRVVSSSERWERRLNGLIRECHLQRAELERTEPQSARLDHLERKIEDLKALASFALPIMRTLADWPAAAKWSAWLDAFEALAPRVIGRPERVLRVLADLRPMGAVGPVSLDEAARVLTNRLSTIESEPPVRRHGRVFVATPAHLRGRTFDVVFIPALAERMFPQKPREDPLLLDGARAGLGAGLVTQADRADAERQQLRLAVGAATGRLYVSFPTVEIGEGRPRVPSLYALEVWRAMTGRVPSADELQSAAARSSQVTLAWPAPADSAEAIDALEHDLATLRRLVDEPDVTARGRAQYILQLNDHLQRSVRERYMRTRKPWSRWDGIVQASERIQPLLAPHRLAARVYSLSALQRYATCPYQFLLGAIYRMRPAEDLEPLQRMDPLTRGSLFHAVQTEFYRRLQASHRLPVTAAGLLDALVTLDACIEDVAESEHDQLAPAIERVWADEIGAIRRDLRLWVDQIAHADDGWVPVKFEWAFGLKGSPQDEGRDPDSRPDPVTLAGRFLLHGSIDLVEEHHLRRDLRVTDHKTGKYRGKDRMVIGGGRTLQPVLYSLALEAALQRPVVAGRLYYATTDGGFRDVTIPITDASRRAGIEALEIVDRAVETGFLAPAPDEGVCTWCDFRPVCGSTAERRSHRKAQEPMADLIALRRKP
ncbi:MAG TPA: PD-(D/E)XK nuclease family protein [Vicinamibacterales bacterium]|nr:PD-(D/E)XK nuclease family protein [Vicinamibacterales bacterium]